MSSVVSRTSKTPWPMIAVAVLALATSSASLFNFEEDYSIPWYTTKTSIELPALRGSIKNNFLFTGFSFESDLCVNTIFSDEERCEKEKIIREWNSLSPSVPEKIKAVSITAAVLSGLATIVAIFGVGTMLFGAGGSKYRLGGGKDLRSPLEKLMSQKSALMAIGTACFLSLSSNIVYGVGIPQSLSDREACKSDLEKAEGATVTGDDACRFLFGKTKVTVTPPPARSSNLDILRDPEANGEEPSPAPESFIEYEFMGGPGYGLSVISTILLFVLAIAIYRSK